MAYIYKIVNDINDKVYIGKTYHSVEKRFREHCLDCKKREYEHRPLYAAMKKYGIEHFSYETLEETDLPEEREKYWIEFYGSFKYGYNATIGGDGKPYADYELIYKLYLEVQTVARVRELTGYDGQTIAHALDTYGITAAERKLNASKTLMKTVAKCDIITGEILEIYPSTKAAEEANGNTRHIAEVCTGKRKSCKGFKWKYI